MDRVFSLDEMADQFWSTHQDADVEPLPSSDLRMNRSPSEWAFQRFLQEAAAPDHTTTTIINARNDDVVEVKDYNHNKREMGPPPRNIPIDSDKCQAFLKSRLELACAAVAMTRATSGNAHESAAASSDVCSQTSNSSQYKDKDGGGQVSVAPFLPAMSKKSVTQVKSTTSGSSGEQSDDDEAEGETQNMDHGDVKRVRRMLSNRESARRSRRRKQAHLTELETQGSQLRVENSSLLKRFTDISQKYNEAAVDNRVLKADVETLRAKVKMAEETVKRVTGLNPFFHAMSEISTMGVGMPSFADTSADAAVPAQDDRKHHYYHDSSNSNHISRSRIQNGLVDIPQADNVQLNATAAVVTTVSMERVDSLEHLQKRIRAGAGPSGTQGAGEK